VLLADDELSLRRSVSYALERDGYDVHTVADGDAALREATSGAFDLAILDVMMPGLNGLDVCREIRAASALPIILLTARDAETDVVIGLEAGADDYVTKPFSVAELASRVRALMRRRRLDLAERGGPRMTVGGIQIDLHAREVVVDGAEVRLTTSEFELLQLLASEPGRVFSRAAIMEHLWHSTFVGDERAADTHVSNLRRKVERDPGQPQRIVTARGVGYKLVEA
jgi:DNA-binding response OmpR family regulator